MKKSLIFSFLLCIVMLFSCVGCNKSVQGSASLIYDKKYYLADSFDVNNIKTNDHYIIFFKNGTGEYYGDGYGEYGAIEFKYLLTDDTVHCFYDGGHTNHYDGTHWNEWYWVKEGVLCREASNAVQYINEDYLSKFPNFGA